VVENQPRSHLQKMLIPKLTKRGWRAFESIANRFLRVVASRAYDVYLMEELARPDNTGLNVGSGGITVNWYDGQVYTKIPTSCSDYKGFGGAICLI